MRMSAIIKYGRICQCCGGTAPEVKINVDHIKPRKTRTELCLSISNLQVLYNLCNLGKGNTFDNDLR